MTNTLQLCCAWLWLCAALLPLPHATASWFSSLSAEAAPKEGPPAGSGRSADEHDRLVSPLLDREIQASVKANWPSSPHNVFCEAYAYLSSEGLGRTYLDRLGAILLDDGSSHLPPSRSSPSGRILWTYESALTAVLQASSYTSRSQKSLLQWFLAMRASSPTCELQRGMADEALSGHLPGSHPLNLDSFGIIYPSGKLIEDWSSIGTHVADDGEARDWSSGSWLIEGEVVLQGGSNATDSLRTNSTGPLVILYANLGSRSFAETYQRLMESRLAFVVRHYGGAAEGGGDVSSPVTVLQGYGVSLDIRNVEYKVFDDRSDKGNTDDPQLLNLSDTALQAPPVFLAGVNVTGLQSTMNETELLQLQASLWRRHDAQQLQSQIVPPVWQRRQLPLQATAVIFNATDPLATLEEISQNLPSLASTLVHVKIPEDLVNRTNGLKPYVGRLYLNGCPIHLGHPTFNVFELMNILRDEQRSLSNMQRNLGPFLDVSQLRLVQQAWSMGSDFLKDAKQLAAEDDDEGEDLEDGHSNQESVFRVDVGHGWKQAVIYLNDVEKDAQYRQWPVRLDQMLMMMQFGRPPSVRRNLFTFLSVLDPTEESDDEGLKLAMQVMSAMYPARTGILIVSKDQVQECAKWVIDNNAAEDTACPVGPVLMRKPASVDHLTSTKASAHAVHTLLSHFARTYGNQGDGGLQAYAEYLLEYISNEKAVKEGGELSMRDLVVIHGSLLEGLNIVSGKEGETEAFNALVEGTQGREDFSYGKALRFAVDKGLSPGLSFLNGRPMPSDGPGAAEIFRAEQGFIVNSIVGGEITDQAPKSVYGKLLTGDLVFQSFHPLLRDDADVEGKYIEPSHIFGRESLLTPMSETKSSEGSAMFLLEAVVDYSTVDGVKLLKTILDAIPLQRSQLSSPDNDNVMLAYRFLPGSTEAAASSLCPILTQASAMTLDTLKDVISAFSSNMAVSVESLLDAVPSVSRSIAQSLLLPTASDLCRSSVISGPETSGNFLLLNGRRYAIEVGTFVDRNTVDILIRLEQKRAKAVTLLLRNGGPLTYDGVSRTAAFLAREETLADGGYKRRRSSPFASRMKSSEALQMSWNHEGGSQNEELQTHLVAIVDPVTLAAQRMSPLLLIARDDLKLPLTILFSPAELIDGDSKVPITSYYRFVSSTELLPAGLTPEAHFHNLPVNHILTLKVDVPEPWNVQQSYAVQDTDNLRCDVAAGCGDQLSDRPAHQERHLTEVEYDLKSLLVFGRCVEPTGRPPNGLQLVLYRDPGPKPRSSPSGAPGEGVEVGMDGSIVESRPAEQQDAEPLASAAPYSDTLVMLNLGYWQLQAAPGAWSLQIAAGTRGAAIFDIVEGTYRGNALVLDPGRLASATSKRIVVRDFVNQMEILAVKRRPGFEGASLFSDEAATEAGAAASLEEGEEVINVFSLATGHLYERFLKIMMLSVTKRTSSKVKFWLFENFLSPSFKASARFMAERIGSQVEFVTYKWPEWLRGQSEKQRIIWGYKILFLDVLFPLSVKKFIYVDADQVLRGDLKELWDLDLHGAPYGYTPFCTSREATLGYQFWREGFWKQHLGDLPYHISALYVVDLELFRRQHVGDTLRSVYQQLSADPNSLANLDQDLPNYAQHQVPIHSLPQEWLWCESWCSDETKAGAKTIDLCNNPLHKEPKVSMAKRVVSGPLFNESWVELDAEVGRYDELYRRSSAAG